MCKRCEEKRDLDRREFLKKSLTGIGSGIMLASPLEIFLGNVLMGMFSRATALAAGDEASFLDQKLVNVSMANAPSRWFWDLPLRPNGNDLFQYNPGNDPKSSMLITKLNPGNGPGGAIGEYATTPVGNYHLPYLWSGKIATPNGSTNMANLASNMLMMRGINLMLDSHELDRYKQVVPSGSDSLMGLVADVATTPLPATGLGGGGNFYHSKKGVSYQDMGGSDPFTTALSPFMNSSGLKTTSADVGPMIDRALNVMKMHAGEKHKYLPNSFQDRLNAKKLMSTQFSNLQQTFSSLKSKYENLIARSFGDSSLFLNGVDASAGIGGELSSNAFKLYLDTSSRVAYYTGSDISSITGTKSNVSTSIANLSSGMAVAEFMLLGPSGAPQSFSSSINIVLGGAITNLIIDHAVSVATSTISEKDYNNVRQTTNVDAHETGAYMQMILFSRYFRALSSCLYELISQLKARGIQGGGTLFDRTAIAVNSEFNRSARNGGDGADHGWAGTCYTLFSGMIPQTMVVGHINHTGLSFGSNYQSTWGYGAPMSEFLGQTGLIGNAASTVATLMDIPTPMPNNPSYVTKDPSTGKVHSAVAEPKNV